MSVARRVGAVSVAALALAVPVGSLAAEPESPPGPCASQAVLEEARTVTCRIEPAATSRRFRFVVRFAGSHDDTALSIVPRLDEAPLACAEGSVTTRTGEDGEVDLRCAFSVPAGGAPRQLVVQVVNRHAQFTGLSLAAE